MTEHGEGAKRVAGPPTTPQKPKHVKTSDGKPASPMRRPPAKNPDGVRVEDWGGAGDCGFRALAAQQAMRNGIGKEAVKQKIAKFGLTLRTKAVLQLKTNGNWENHSYLDSERTELTEGGSLPQNIEQHLEACSRPNKWIHG